MEFEDFIDKPPLTVIYGQAGVGKTTFSCKTGIDTVIFPIENGLASVSDLVKSGAVKVPKLDGTYTGVIKNIDWLIRNPDSFGVAVFDTVDSLEDVIAEHLAQHDEDVKRARNALGHETSSARAAVDSLAYGRGGVKMAGVFKSFLRRMDALKNAGIMPILLAHTEIKDHDTDAENSVRKQDLKLSRKNLPLLHECADLILRMGFEISYSEGKGGKTVAVAQKDQNGEKRILQSTASLTSGSKKRFNIPDVLRVNEKTWDVIFNKIPFYNQEIQEKTETKIEKNEEENV